MLNHQSVHITDRYVIELVAEETNSYTEFVYKTKKKQFLFTESFHRIEKVDLIN